MSRQGYAGVFVKRTQKGHTGEMNWCFLTKSESDTKNPEKQGAVKLN